MTYTPGRIAALRDDYAAVESGSAVQLLAALDEIERLQGIVGDMARRGHVMPTGEPICDHCGQPTPTVGCPGCGEGA